MLVFVVPPSNELVQSLICFLHHIATLLQYIKKISVFFLMQSNQYKIECLHIPPNIFEQSLSQSVSLAVSISPCEEGSSHSSIVGALR